VFETTDSSRPYLIGAPAWIALAAAGLIAIFCITVLNGEIFEPLAKHRDAMRWKENPCVIVSSRLVAHRMSRGRKDLVAEVTFGYKATFPSSPQPIEFTSERFAFDSAWWPDSRKKSFVASNPAGKQTTCYVNPEHPWDAVMVRELHLVNIDSSTFSVLALLSLAACVGLVIHIRAVVRGTKPEDEWWWNGLEWLMKRIQTQSAEQK